MTTPDIAGLCERLRTGTGLSEPVGDSGGVIRDAWVHSIMQQAARTLEHQAAEIERLRGALGPFALAAENMDGDEPDTLFIYDSPESAMIDYGDLRRARAALTGED